MGGTYSEPSRATTNTSCPGYTGSCPCSQRWLLGTHQGGIAPQHLDDYLDEFVFRFNRRKSASRGKLFYRLAQQAVEVEPTPYGSLTTPKP